MIKKLFITTVVGTLAYFLFGWFTFDFILGDYADLNTTQIIGFKKTGDQFNLLLLILSCGAYATLLSFILVYLLNLKNLVKAFFIGSVIGLLVAIMADVYWYATSYFYSNLTVMLFDIVAAAITVGFMGWVITLTNKKLTSRYTRDFTHNSD